LVEVKISWAVEERAIIKVVGDTICPGVVGEELPGGQFPSLDQVYRRLNGTVCYSNAPSTSPKWLEMTASASISAVAELGRLAPILATPPMVETITPGSGEEAAPRVPPKIESDAAKLFRKVFGEARFAAVWIGKSTTMLATLKLR
jgi:hypothetical protein